MGQPIDKQEAYFYGQFVQAAYTMFKTPKGLDPMRPDPDGIPPGYELGAWIHMSDFFLNIVEPKFYGIVVHEIANPDSRIIAIRGTEGLVEWLDDSASLIHVPFRQVPTAGLVAYGFDKIYSTMKVVKRRIPVPGAVEAAGPAVEAPFTGSFADQLEQLAQSREAERGVSPESLRPRLRPARPTVVTGHSLGGALTTLFVMENDSKKKFDLNTLCTFASPHVGNMAFAQKFNQLPINSWRIFNQRDIVPKLPPHVPLVLDYVHVDAPTSFDSSGFAKNNVGCWHSLDTYLHWLNPTSPLTSDCVP